MPPGGPSVFGREDAPRAQGRPVFAIKQRLGLPVKFVGVGEQLDDLEDFDPDAFVNALFEKE
jgi:fused signal recognition particle receptor